VPIIVTIISGTNMYEMNAIASDPAISIGIRIIANSIFLSIYLLVY